MNNAAPALLALLLVLALPATAVVAAETANTSVETNANTVAASDPITANGTTNRLSLDGEIRSSHAAANPDLGTTLATQDMAMRAEYNTYWIETEFENGTDAERQAIAEANHERIKERVANLIERERAAVNAHANGNLSDDELLQTLVVISAEAAELETRIDQLNDYHNEGHISLNANVEKGEVATLQSPVRDRIASFMGGERSSAKTFTTVSVQTSETGMAISMTGRIEYVREVSRYDNHNTSLPSQFDSFTSGLDHMTELYPWTFGEASSGNIRAFAPYVGPSYGFTVPHAHGELTAYLDRGTGAIYHETQVLQQNQLPKEPLEQTWTNGSVELAINRTPANGPIEVTTTDVETGEPVRATVLVDGTVVGNTGQSGTLWVSPPQNDYEIATRTSEATVNASISTEPLSN